MGMIHPRRSSLSTTHPHLPGKSPQAWCCYQYRLYHHQQYSYLNWNDLIAWGLYVTKLVWMLSHVDQDNVMICHGLHSSIIISMQSQQTMLQKSCSDHWKGSWRVMLKWPSWLRKISLALAHIINIVSFTNCKRKHSSVTVMSFA